MSDDTSHTLGPRGHPVTAPQIGGHSDPAQDKKTQQEESSTPFSAGSSRNDAHFTEEADSGDEVDDQLGRDSPQPPGAKWNSDSDSDSSDDDSLASARTSSSVDPIDPHIPEEQPAARNPYDPYAPAHQEAESENSQEHLAICRICLDGPGGSGENGESLGRLLSPCRCKGTMKYVHATCLDRWRAMSSRNSSVVACDQCGAPYRFRKSKFVGLATSPSLLFVVSVVVFLFIIWTVGFVAGLVLDRYDSSQVNNRSRSNQRSSTSRWSRWWNGDAADQDSSGWGSYSPDSWTDLDSSYSYSYHYGYGGLYYEPAAYFKLIKEAVRQFTSGEASQAVRGLVGVGDDGMEPPSNVQPSSPEAASAIEPNTVQDAAQQAADKREHSEKGFWSSLLWEWKYGEGGIWEGQDPAQVSSASEVIDARESEATSSEIPRERYDARTASEFDAEARKRTENRLKSQKQAAQANRKRGWPSWLDKLALQFSLGFSLVGIVSFVNLLLGVSFLGPFNLHNFGLGRSFARMTGGGRRNGGQRGEGVNIASIVLVILVLIGILRALHLVYKAVRALSRRFLSRLEAAIVDWHGEDEEDQPTDQADAARQREAAANRVGLRRRPGFGSDDELLGQQRDNRMAWMMARAGD